MTFVPGALPDGQLERRRDRLERQQALEAIAVLDAIIAARDAHAAFGSPPSGAGHVQVWELSITARNTMRAADRAVAEYRARWPR